MRIWSAWAVGSGGWRPDRHRRALFDERFLAARHQQFRDQTSPAGLVRSAEADARVTVKIFVEQDVVAEIGVALQLVVVAVHRAAAGWIAQKETRQASGDFFRYFVDGDKAARARRAFDFEVVAVVVVKLLQRFDDQVIDGEPNRSAPVGIPAEGTRARFGGLVVHGVEKAS